jgi:sucrose-6-phosphate hydrolase SacC (GH32 family)
MSLLCCREVVLDTDQSTDGVRLEELSMIIPLSIFACIGGAQALALSPLYHETYRPQFHFTARQFTEHILNPQQRQEGWINDLNGLIYYDGEYHLFAQRWAKCWIHAVSRDMIHWRELEPAFWEETEGSGVQSGTCVIDYHNTSGSTIDPSASVTASTTVERGLATLKTRSWKRRNAIPKFSGTNPLAIG